MKTQLELFLRKTRKCDAKVNYWLPGKFSEVDQSIFGFMRAQKGMHFRFIDDEVIELWELVEEPVGKETQPDPPAWAEWLLILCSGSGQHAERLLGDLTEQFN